MQNIYSLQDDILICVNNISISNHEWWCM